MTSQQDDVIRFLSDAASYGPGAGRVEIIETHGALVFLTAAQAWKIKKAVKFGYMDFSTLERRQAACHRELEINRPHAPEIYLGLVPLTRDATGALSIDGEGEVVEWAVHMRRFAERDVLASVAREGRLTNAMIERLCGAIISYHCNAPVCAVAGFATRMQHVLDTLNTSFERADKSLPEGLAGSFASRAARHLAQCKHLLEQRGHAGFVRRCHGDMHLSNIVLLEGVPVLFDAIEFDEKLATIDVLYDLAFALMDLCHQNLTGPANRLLNCYLRAVVSGDVRLSLAGLRAMPLFIAARAGVRAMVLLDRAAQHDDSANRQDMEIARAYLRQAVSELAPVKPRLVAIGGYSGTGKTTVAAELCPKMNPRPGALHLRTDVERKLMAGVALDERLPPESYTRKASDAVYAQVLEKARLALAAGWPVVVDAAFLDPLEREQVAQLAKAGGVEFTGLWLQADEATLVDRVTARHGDASDANADVVRRQLARGAGSIAWQRIDAGGNIDETLAACVSALAEQAPCTTGSSASS